MWVDMWARAHVFRCPPLAGGTSDYSLWFPLARLVLMFVCIILRIYINFGSPLQGPSDSASNAVRLPLHDRSETIHYYLELAGYNVSVSCLCLCYLEMADCVDRNLACRLEKISPANSWQIVLYYH
jgi:hypothetical protein